MAAENDGAVGKWFEGEAQKVFKSLASSSTLFSWARFYDAHTAGGFFPEQPADYLLSFRRDAESVGTAVMAELKASDVSETLNRGYKQRIEPSQWRGCRMWLRSGSPYVFIFHGRAHGTLELWDGAEVLAAKIRSDRRLKVPPKMLLTGVKDTQAAVKTILNNLIEELHRDSTYLQRPASWGDSAGQHDGEIP